MIRADTGNAPGTVAIALRTSHVRSCTIPHTKGPISALERLAEVLERLGRAAADVTATPEPVYDPVPAWLSARLEHTVGMAPAEIRKLAGARAMDLWDQYRTGQNPKD